MKQKGISPIPIQQKLSQSFKSVRLLHLLISFIAVCVCFLGIGAFNQTLATTYYVDNSITDTNPASATPDCTNYNTGTFTCSGGAGSAYKTIADVNAKSFSPDDQVLFRKGQTWREQLTPASSGTSGHPITFGAFGSGAKPIISGADIITGWTNYSGNTWQATVTTQPNIVFFDGTHGTLETAIGNINAQYEWYWASNVLYVYSTSDPDSAYTIPGIEAGQRNNAIFIANRSYISIDSLDCKYTNSNIFTIGGTGSNTIIQNSTASWSAGSGIGIYDSYGGSNLIYNNTIHDVDVDGISASPHTGSGLGTETTVRGNTIYNIYRFPIWLQANYYIVENNLIRDSGHNTVSGGEFIGIQVYSANSGASQGQNNIIRYNNIYNMKSCGNDRGAIEFDRWTTGNVAYGNIGYNNDGPRLTFYGAPSNKAYNNTFYGNSQNSCAELTNSSEIRLMGTATEKSNNIEVKNNIAHATVVNEYAIYVDSNTYNQTLDITNNIYYSTASNWYYWNNAGGNNLTTWNGYTGVGTDLNSNPYFVDGGDTKPYPYFYPRSYSPVINAGVDVGLTKDYLGTSVPQAAAPDIGAFEYTVSIPENIWFFFPLFLALPRLIFLLSKAQDRKLFLRLLRHGRYQAVLRELYLPYLNLVSSLAKRGN